MEVVVLFGVPERDGTSDGVTGSEGGGGRLISVGALDMVEDMCGTLRAVGVVLVESSSYEMVAKAGVWCGAVCRSRAQVSPNFVRCRKFPCNAPGSAAEQGRWQAGQMDVCVVATVSSGGLRLWIVLHVTAVRCRVVGYVNRSETAFIELLPLLHHTRHRTLAAAALPRVRACPRCMGEETGTALIGC